MPTMTNQAKALLMAAIILLTMVVGIQYDSQIAWDFTQATNLSAAQTAAIAAEIPPVYYTNQVAILMYHNLSAQESTSSLSPEHFAEQIEALEKKGYNFVSLDQLELFLSGQNQLPANAVALTFDDGYESFYQHAYPLLIKEQIPSAMFVIVKHVGAIENEIPKLTWPEIQEMQNRGVSFHSHTYDSHRLITPKNGSALPALVGRQYNIAARRNENQDEYERRINDDLALARNILADALGTQADWLALPYGIENDTVRNIAQRCGYQYILTVDPGMVTQDADTLALKRINAGQAGIDGETLHKTILNYAR